ncbi:hypothetical protein PIB30_096657 [Stylosanthes scabra]|uniref:Uncharacterized protein n=1 Tax=Stylosanthes scabra TaxID=79078 RepID=A0ABU6UYG2_9FABA|nr:hypothetical protein [Stylosanthes scabra]
MIETVADANQHFSTRAKSKGVHEVAPSESTMLAKTLAELVAMVKEIKEGITVTKSGEITNPFADTRLNSSKANSRILKSSFSNYQRFGSLTPTPYPHPCKFVSNPLSWDQCLTASLLRICRGSS